MRVLPVLRAAVVGCLVAALAAAPAAQSAPQPVRSGAIVGGINNVSGGFGAGNWGCADEPDCSTWLASGCDPLVAVVDSGIQTAIVDIRSIAGSKRRLAGATLGILVPTVGESSTMFLDASMVVEFWSAGCTQLSRTGGNRFVIPSAAAWMTIVPPWPAWVWELY